MATAPYPLMAARPPDPVPQEGFTSRDPTWRERVASLLAGDDAYRYQRIIGMLGDPAGSSPEAQAQRMTNPLGVPFQMQEDMASKNALATAGDVLSVLPVGVGGAALKKGGEKIAGTAAEKLAKKLDDERAILGEIRSMPVTHHAHINDFGPGDLNLDDSYLDVAESRASPKFKADAPIPQEQWGPYSTLLGAYDTTTPGRILNKIDKGGYSVNVPTGDTPTTGIMSGIYPNTDARTVVRPADTPMTREDVLAFNRRNAKKLNEGADIYLGGWKNSETGAKYLDVSKRFEPDQVRQATKFAERTAQEKLYDVGADKELPVGNWQQFIHGDVYKQRLLKALEHGNQYMQGKTPWWELPVFEEIYGKDRMQQIKGFLATTSSNTPPPKNVQAATEYIRRLIAGEPIVQPNWRAPQNIMGGYAQPGGIMPLEANRANNLRAAAEGKPLSGEVVREKMAAMSGDPNAVVLDRIQVYPTEDPATGVYADAQRGKGPDEGDLREEWRNVVRGVMRDAGVEPRTGAANAWVGLREGGSPTGASYGYNDLAVDLIAKKAQHLGISIDRMKQLLGQGKGELLAKTLGIPTAAAAGYGMNQRQEQGPYF